MVLWGLKCVPGENKVNVSSALSFIKLLFHFKQPETCGRLTKEMQQVLSVSNSWQLPQVSNVRGSKACLIGFVSLHQALEGQSFRKAESELALLGSLNSLLCAERSRGRDDLMPDGKLCRMKRHHSGGWDDDCGYFYVTMNDSGSFLTVRRRSLFQVSEELTGLVRALHSSVCLLSPVSMTRVWKIKVDVKLLAVDFHDAVVFPCRRFDPTEAWCWMLCYFCGIRWKRSCREMNCKTLHLHTTLRKLTILTRYV